MVKFSRLVLLLTITVSFRVISAPPIVTVSKKQFGDKWIFKREEVMLECRTNGALFVINPSTLMQYPLNNIAVEQMKKREIIASQLSAILLKPTNLSQQKIDITPILKTAQNLCKTN
ncbi:YebY family protein [Arsenophonus apicola]|uniref:YebY family protein n=1 Tax=Arsenophonus apicola TaxID=2879119 RepID=UPI00387A787C